MNSLRREKTLQFFVEQSTGHAPIAGGMASVIKEHQAELLKRHHEKSLEQWILDADLRIWFSEYGKCLMSLNPKEARCHSQAGTNPWDTLAPNYQQRAPSTCLGCKCFAVDAEHKVFWEQRLNENASVFEQTPEKEVTVRKLLKERMQQAQTVLQAITVTK